MRRSPRPALAAPLIAGALALTGCATTSSGPPKGSADPEPGDAVVELVGLTFEPGTIQVPVGQRVRWQWTDSVVHNVVSRDFASSKALSGGAHVVRFERAGTFPYTCTLHPGMDGTVVVTP